MTPWTILVERVRRPGTIGLRLARTPEAEEPTGGGGPPGDPNLRLLLALLTDHRVFSLHDILLLVRHRMSGKVESEALTEDLDWFKGERSVGTGRILIVPTDTPPAEDTQHKSGEGHEQK